MADFGGAEIGEIVYVAIYILFKVSSLNISSGRMMM